MHTAFIVNPNSGSADEGESLHHAISERADWKLFETQSPEHGVELTVQAVEQGFERVVAAGGDGTINEVVNGLMQAQAEIPLGIIPLGTGNDLARTLAIPNDIVEAIALLDSGDRRALDVIKVTHAFRTPRFAINVAAGGFSGAVDEVLTADMKAAWGPFAYVRSAAEVFPDLSAYRTFMRFDDGPEVTLQAINVIVANARTAAGGLNVSPHSNPEDGKIDVVVIQDGTSIDLAVIIARLIAGDITQSEGTIYRRVSKVAVSSEPGMWFNLDGELYTKEPLTFEVQPHALRIIVGSDYECEP